jgi:hypothetical protein
MINIGFQSVVQIHYKWPQNIWPKDKHYKTRKLEHDQHVGWDPWIFGSFVHSGSLGMSSDELETLLVGVRKDIQNR